MGDNAKEEDMIPVYVLLYFVFLTLSYLYISAKGYKDRGRSILHHEMRVCLYHRHGLFGISMH